VTTSSNRYPVRSDATTWSRFDSDLIVFNAFSKQYFTLNATAARIFELSSGDTPEEEIADVLVGDFDADPAAVRSDVHTTVEGMVELGLLELR
jgi:pyrroloquinoline quinone biosynthesis protein D